MLCSKPWRIKRSVIQHYDRIAPIYNALYSHEQNQKIKKVLYALSFSPSERILDVGCGTGLLFEHIANVAGEIIGVDIASEPLRIAKKIIKDFNLSKVFLIRADADFLPFKDRVFDKVFAITLLQNLPNPLSTLREMVRVAKDEATFIITGLKKIFSRESLSNILRGAGLRYILLNDEENLKCHIAICYRNVSSKSINKGEVEILA